MRFLKNLLCVLILSFTGVNVAAQQITGSIRGGISDPSGAVVQDATVTAKQMETGLIRTVSSAKDGSFLLVELPVGHYSLEVAARGFQKYVQEGISLNVNETVQPSLVHVVLGRLFGLHVEWASAQYLQLRVCRRDRGDRKLRLQRA